MSPSIHLSIHSFIQSFIYAFLHSSCIQAFRCFTFQHFLKSYFILVYSFNHLFHSTDVHSLFGGLGSGLNARLRPDQVTNSTVN